jgi:hypothetical protein
MERNNTSDIANLKLMFITYLNFDLENTNNTGHPFYENFQKLLLLNPQSSEYKYIFFYYLFGPVDYFSAMQADIYEFWRNRIVQNKNSVGIYGDIFEIFIQWTLLLKNIAFVKHERPDFIITYENEKIFLECGSTFFDGNKPATEKDVFKKIKTVVKNNLKTGYLNLKTALFIDVTNLVYHFPSLDSEFLKKALISAENDLRQKNITFETPGSITFLNFEFINNIAGQNHACNIIGNFIRPNIDKRLSSFLSQNFIPKIPTETTIFPKFGH